MRLACHFATHALHFLIASQGAPTRATVTVVRASLAHKGALVLRVTGELSRPMLDLLCAKRARQASIPLSRGELLATLVLRSPHHCKACLALKIVLV